MWSLGRPDYTWVKTPAQASRLKERLLNRKEIAIDTETTGLDISKDSVVVWSMSTGLKNRYFFERDMLEEFQKVFEDPDKIWIGTNTKYDAHMLRNSGFPLEGELRCTLVMDKTLYGETYQRHDLKNTYMREFNEHVKTFEEAMYPISKSTGKPIKPKNKTTGQIILEQMDTNPENVIEYASLDPWMSLRLYRRLRDKLKEKRTFNGYSLWELYLMLEVPFTRVLYNCEVLGTLIDQEYLEELQPKIEEELFHIEKKLNKVAGKVINPRSPVQLRALFFDKLGIKPVKKTKTGALSVDADVIKALANRGIKEVKLLERHRSLSKTLNTYIVNLLKSRDEDGRIHTTFHQATVKTGRISSTNPPLQTMPRPESDEWILRKAFIAKPGHRILSCDYSQLEMVVMAHFSGDTGMIKTIMEGKDIHSGNASTIWGTPYKDIIAARKKKENKSKLTEYDITILEYRHRAKTIGFGLNYGKGRNLLAVELGIPDRLKKENPRLSDKQIKYKANDEAQALIDTYFDKLPGVKEFIDWTHEEVSCTKYVQTILGRRRWLFEAMDQEEQDEHLADALASGYRYCRCDQCEKSGTAMRQAVNSIIQGSAADIMQMAMIKMNSDEQLSECGMLFPVHDEIVYEIPDELVEEAGSRIVYNMENCGISRFSLPLTAEYGVGDSWAEAH